MFTITSLLAVSNAGRKGRSDHGEGLADHKALAEGWSLKSPSCPAQGDKWEVVEEVEERDEGAVFDENEVERARNEGMEKRPGSLQLLGDTMETATSSCGGRRKTRRRRKRGMEEEEEAMEAGTEGKPIRKRLPRRACCSGGNQPHEILLLYIYKKEDTKGSKSSDAYSLDQRALSNFAREMLKKVGRKTDRSKSKHRSFF